ncbi:MAG: glycosyltransferase family 4 protein, partial [Deltaproteobacteria bacterium]|nr:glycosyltransferase family 4 protein [Deltaproteobacteria bacterium]
MKILQISTYDVSGGAARATYRLHRGLREIGEDCRMLVRHKDSDDPAVFLIELEEGHGGEEFFLGTAVQAHYIDTHRTDISDTIFSLPYPGYDISRLDMVREADIINLHWVARYQSLVTLHRLFSSGKPVVWTLHDQWAFTGGCHYTAGCERYCGDCARCPQLSDDPFDLPGGVLKDKLEFLKGANLTIVTPSRWLATCAGESKLFQDLRIEVIPNSLETDVFRPLPKAEAKKSMGITPDITTLLFGGEYGNEKRKGFHELTGAIKCCLGNDDFKGLVNADKVKLICFGYASDELGAVGIPVEALGYLDSDEKIMRAYCAADIFVLPSLEDNLPNTMLEAMSCGTPVVAFDVGGMPDAVINGVTGQLVPLGDTRGMGNAILSLIFNSEKRDLMGKECRKNMEEQYKLEIQARRYLDLYQELLEPLASRDRAVSHDHTSTAWQIPAKARPLPVIPELSLGVHFKGIYDQVLFKALKESGPHAQRQLQASEADSAARLEVIHDLGEKVQA